MTTGKPDDSRDPRVDAAWRAMSREEPSRALDDAIRAAARRGSGAGPRPVDAGRPAVPAALGSERWWWPLAAAATIGAVAIGLLQLATQDHRGQAGDVISVVSDMPSTASPSVQPRDPAFDDTPKLTASPAPLAAGAPASPASNAQERTRVEAANAVPPRAMRKNAPSTAGSMNAGTSPSMPAPAPAAATSAVEARQRAGADAAQPARAAEPFPADATRREVAGASVAAPPTATAGTVEPGPAVAPQRSAAPVANVPARRAGARDAAEAQGATVTAPAAAHAGAPVAQSGTPAPMAVRKTSESEGARALGKTVAEPSIAKQADDRAKDRAKLPAAEWVALIRKLREEGRTDDAAKELAAFRVAYPDHARLLPPDLRDGQPAEK